MIDRFRDILFRLSILPLLAVCLFTGGASSPFRFFFFPLLSLLSLHMAPNAVLQTGIAFSLFYAVLPLLNKAAGTSALAPAVLEFVCYILTTLAATRIASVRHEENRRYLIAESTFQGISNELSHRSMNLQTTLDALSQAHSKLQELDRNRTGFLSNIAHELRTPLSGIRSYSEILLTYNDLDNATQREFTEIIHSESVRLTNLVNELLNLIKIQTGKIELALGRVDAAELIDNCIKVMKPMAAERGLQLTASIPPDTVHIKADMDQVTQVLINLVNNAIKFTRQGGVTVGVVSKGDEADFFVSDTGEGIFPEEQEKIFEEFYRVLDNVPDRPQGSGLGLSICKKIVEFHGGEISVESSIGKGSTFRFTIPLLSSGDQPLLPDAGLKPRRHHDQFRPILVVIENNAERAFLRKSLEGVGYKTIGAMTYDNACLLAKASPVDLIIAEILNNREGLESLSALALSEGTPFFMAYFYSEPPGIISLVISAYVWKPFDSYQILQLIEPFKKNRMKFAIISPDMDESRMLQMILGVEGYATSVFSNVDDFIPCCDSLCPDAIIIGSFAAHLVDNIVLRVSAVKAMAQVPLFLVLNNTKPGGQVKLVTLSAQFNRPLQFGLSPLIQEIENELFK